MLYILNSWASILWNSLAVVWLPIYDMQVYQVNQGYQSGQVKQVDLVTRKTRFNGFTM